MIACKITGSFLVFKRDRIGRHKIVTNMEKEFPSSDDAFDVLSLFHDSAQTETTDVEIDGRNYFFYKIESMTVRDGLIV